MSISGLVEEWSEREEYQDYSQSGLRKCIREAGNKAFGVTADETSEGIYGTRHYAWCIKIYHDGANRYRLLTTQEQKLFDELTEYYCKSDAKKTQKLELLDAAYKEDKNMSKEDYFRYKGYLKENDNFNDVLSAFKDKTGLQLVHATEHEIKT